MKRDLDLVRKILLEMESREAASYPPQKMLHVEGYDDRLVKSHVNLMREAGLLTVFTVQREERPKTITWLGHDFLDASRSDTLWESAKKHFKEKGISMTLELTTAWLKMVAKEKLGMAAE